MTKKKGRLRPVWRGGRLGAAGVGLILSVHIALGSIPSGNEFALYLSEAKTPAAQKTLVDQVLGKPHFFRYLRIVELEQGETGGYPFVAMTTCEPSSRLTVKFKVVKTLSLATLKEAPASGVDDAIAVTGVIESVDPTNGVIVLNQAIVRYKDRVAPKVGKEMHYERDASGIVYSFTAGKEPVNVSKRDEDLLQYEEKILAERGNDGWARFLLDEIAKRNKAAKAERDKLGIYRKDVAPTEPSVPAAPAQSVITDDED